MKLKYNIPLTEIDNLITSFSEIELSKNDYFNLFMLIEQKISKVLNEDDVRSFQSLIQELDLSEEDKKRLIFLRNIITHEFISENELDKYKLWIKEKIIPIILNLNPKYEIEILHQYSIQNNALYAQKYFLKEIISIAKRKGFEIIKNYEIMMYKNYTLNPDLILEKDKIRIIIEIKKKFNYYILEIGLQKLKEYLSAAKTKWGVLLFLEPIKKTYLKNIKLKTKHYDIIIVDPNIYLNTFVSWMNKFK